MSNKHRENNNEKKSGRKKWLWLLLIPALAAVILLVGVLGKGKPKNAVVSYTTEKVASRTIIKTLEGSGTLEPANSYIVNTLVEGDIIACGYDEGDTVEKDTVLYQIDASDTSTNIERSQLSVSQAQRNYNKITDKQYIYAKTTGKVDTLDVDVGDEVSAGQTVATIRDTAELTLEVPFPADDAATFHVGQSAIVTLDSTFEKLHGTVKSISGSNTVGMGNVITRRVSITVKNPGALTETQSATAAIDGIQCAGGATFRYKSAGSVIAEMSGTVLSLSVREGDSVKKDQLMITLSGSDIKDTLQDASDNLRSAQLNLESSQKQLENYTIQSPIAGTIVDRQVKAGDKVSAGEVLCTIYDLSYLEMTLNIDELDISSIAVGQSVNITADAVEGASYVGTVTKVSVAGTTAGGVTSYPVTVRIDETQGLLPGMNVDAEIVIAEAKDVLSIPSAAVERGNLVLVTVGSPSAANAEKNGKAPDGYVYVKVETGVSDDDYIEIVSGLQDGDTVGYIPPVIETGNDLFSGMMGMHNAAVGGGEGNAPAGGPSSGGNMRGGPRS